MNTEKVIKQDTEFYAEFVEETGMWCIIGNNTGFMYSTDADEDNAIIQAAILNAGNK